MKIEIDIKDCPGFLLEVLPMNEEPQNCPQPKFSLQHKSEESNQMDTYLRITLLENNVFRIDFKHPDVSETEQNLKAKLENLADKLINSWREGINPFEEDEDETAISNLKPYDVRRIRIDTKTFPLRQIKDMIVDGDLDLSPDFQRNFVWEQKRQSQLIESVLLRIPLPVFYFSQDEDGTLHVVDGVQRLTSIYNFMSGKTKLSKLEYLSEVEGLYFPVKGADGESRTADKVLDEKSVRIINQTQILVNIIDSQSPSQVKYDVFRRINTGGRPLNHQEIRNCIASTAVRDLLNRMSQSVEFLEATQNKVPVTRMVPEELALRFITFRRFLKSEGGLDNYSLSMEATLNQTVDELSVSRNLNMASFLEDFRNAMKNAAYLFGNVAFRKIDLNTNRRRGGNVLNKALFLSWSLVLADLDHDEIRKCLPQDALVEPLRKRISEDYLYSFCISNGTNDKVNIKRAYETAQDIIRAILNLN